MPFAVQDGNPRVVLGSAFRVAVSSDMREHAQYGLNRKYAQEYRALNSFSTNWPSAEAPNMQDLEQAQAAGQGLDIIFIDGFIGETVIGIHHDELHATQPLRIDLAAGLPRSLACDTDRIGDTIDYSVVHGALTEMLANHKFQLLEAFAEGVAAMLLGRFGAHWVRVRITKPHKFANVEGVGVMIERRRSPNPAPEGRSKAEILKLIGAGLVPGQRR